MNYGQQQTALGAAAKPTTASASGQIFLCAVSASFMASETGTKSGETPAAESSVGEEERRKQETIDIVRNELKDAYNAYKALRDVPGTAFAKIPEMPVTQMRRCLKHGRQRLQCSRPHAPLALCERVIGPLTLAEFGHWLQLLYHLRRFVKGLVRGHNVSSSLQTQVLHEAQSVIMLHLDEPDEEALWNMEYAYHKDVMYTVQQVHDGSSRGENAAASCFQDRGPPVPGTSAVTPALNSVGTRTGRLSDKHAGRRRKPRKTAMSEEESDSLNESTVTTRKRTRRGTARKLTTRGEIE